MSYKNGASIEEAFLCGTVSAVCTTASIGNLANHQGPALSLAATATVDLVFGTGYNLISASTYKAVTGDSAVSTNTIDPQKPKESSSTANSSLYHRLWLKERLHDR